MPGLGCYKLTESSTQDNVSILETLVTFLQENGNRQAILSETGGGETTSCYTE